MSRKVSANKSSIWQTRLTFLVIMFTLCSRLASAASRSVHATSSSSSSSNVRRWLGTATNSFFGNNNKNFATGLHQYPPTTRLLLGGTHRRLAFVRPSYSLFLFHSSTRVPSNNKSRGRQSTHLRASSKKGKKQKDLFRADRVLAQRSQRSRSECFDLLKQKRVWSRRSDEEQQQQPKEFTTTNIQCHSNDDADNDDWILIPGPSAKLSMHTPLWIDKTHVVPFPPPLAMVYHKPKWVLSVTADPHLNRPCLDDTVVPHGMHPVGRLDYDSSGLLLFSSSGPLTQRLLHPKHDIAKVYQVVVTGAVDEEKLEQELTNGVQTGEGIHTADLLAVEPWENEAVAPYLESVRANLPTHYNQTDLEQRGYLDIFKAQALTTVTLRVREGKYRMVRRIMANCGHPVVTLVRKQFGEIQLDDLTETTLRQVTPKEEAWLQSILKDK